MGDRFEIKQLNEALKIVKNNAIENILNKFSKDFSQELKFQGIFLSIDEILYEIKDRIIGIINEDYKEIKNRITYLRKRGEKVNTIDYNLLRVPLKIKILRTEFNMNNYDDVIKIINETKSFLEEYVDINEDNDEPKKIEKDNSDEMEMKKEIEELMREDEIEETGESDSEQPRKSVKKYFAEARIAKSLEEKPSDTDSVEEEVESEENTENKK